MLVRNLFSKVSMDASDFSAGAQRLPHGANALSVTSDGTSPVLVKYKPVFLGV